MLKINLLCRAHDLDPDDADILCQLSLNYALSGEVRTVISGLFVSFWYKLSIEDD